MDRKKFMPKRCIGLVVTTWNRNQSWFSLHI